MDVSIIIVNYNTSALINDCIRSIFNYTKGIDYEIIVVDNASENLSETIESASDPRVHLIQLPKNVGFGRANNAGFKVAQGRNLFCLNPDTLLLNNAIKILSDFLDANLGAGACGGNLFDTDMQPTLSFRRLLPGVHWELNELLHLWPERLFYGRNQRFNYTNTPLNVGYITGADLMIRASIANYLGGYSPEFFMYYEETDLCARIHRAGYGIYSIPTAHIQHLEGGSFDNNTINTSRFERSERGRAIYYRRNHSRLNTAVANAFYYLFLISRAIVKQSATYKYRLKLLWRLKTLMK